MYSTYDCFSTKWRMTDLNTFPPNEISPESSNAHGDRKRIKAVFNFSICNSMDEISDLNLTLKLILIFSYRGLSTWRDAGFSELSVVGFLTKPQFLSSKKRFICSSWARETLGSILLTPFSFEKSGTTEMTTFPGLSRKVSSVWLTHLTL